MSNESRHHFEWNEIKKSILKFILKTKDPVNEPKISENLRKEYGEQKKDGKFDRSTVNKHLNALGKSGCIESVKSENKSKFKFYEIKTLKNLSKIIEEYPDLVEILQNNEHALKIVLNELEDALISSTSPKEIEQHKEYDEIKEYLSNIRENLSVKLKMSSAFLKLCIQDSYSLYRNVTELMEISDEGPCSHAFIGDDFKFFVKSTSGIDVAFKACVALDIMERKGNMGKDMRKEIEYVKEMNNEVSKIQLDELEKYYEKLTDEAKLIKQMEKDDPDKQLEYLKNNYENYLKAPGFIKWKKFVQVKNNELRELEEEFEARGGKWDYFKDEKPDGPA